MTRNLVVSEETHSQIFSLKGHLQIKNYQKFRNMDHVVIELMRSFKEHEIPQAVKVMEGMYQLEEKL